MKKHQLQFSALRRIALIVLLVSINGMMSYAAAADVVTHDGLRVGLTDEGYPYIGEPDAPVTLEEWSDYRVKTAKSVVVTYEVEVTNESTAEALTLTLLTDDQFGNLDGKGSCTVPQSIAIGGSYTCTFNGAVDSSPHTNEATGTVVDDEASPPVTPKDTATVTFQ